jgi:hypothetical protein
MTFTAVCLLKADCHIHQTSLVVQMEAQMKSQLPENFQQTI